MDGGAGGGIRSKPVTKNIILEILKKIEIMLKIWYYYIDIQIDKPQFFEGLLQKLS